MHKGGMLAEYEVIIDLQYFYLCFQNKAKILFYLFSDISY